VVRRLGLLSPDLRRARVVAVVMTRLATIAALGIAAAFYPLAARAEMPDYDVNVYCKQVAAVGGAPSQMILGGCYRQEQESYDALKPTWDQLPATMRAYCDQVARVGGSGGAYMILKGCIDQEQQSAQQNGAFKFRR
jgi:hypothetical protein